MRHRLALAACMAALALALPAVALAAHSLRFTIGKFEPAPGVHEYLEGPCGAAVDSHGDLYVSDYYHDKIDVFSSSGSFIAQVAGVSPLDGPCGLAVDSTGRIYANAYHEGVLELTPSAYPPTRATTYSAPVAVVEGVHATGIALDPASGNLLVDERTSIAEYEAPLAPGAEPLRRIGAGTLEDGYGLAVSGYAGTSGYVYAADAASETVKAYDPATSLTAPVATYGGEGTPLGRFNDLTDAALALDDSDGHLYVADNADGRLFEHPRAGIEELDAAGAFVGEVLPPGATGPSLVDGQPSGLAVDDSGAATQGDLYVTDGNTEESHLLAFGPTVAGSAVSSAPEPAAAPSSAGSSAETNVTPTVSASSLAAPLTAAVIQTAAASGQLRAQASAAATAKPRSRRRRHHDHRHRVRRRAGTEEVTRETYKAAVEPICLRNTKANERIFAGVRAEVNHGKLKPAAHSFKRAAAALRRTIAELRRVRQPSADRARLARWLAKAGKLAGSFGVIAKKLRAGEKGKAGHLVARLDVIAAAANAEVIEFGFHSCRLEPSKFT